MKISATPVQGKKRAQVEDPRATVEAVAQRGGDQHADEGADERARGASLRRAAASAWPSRKSEVSMPSADDRGEGEDAEAQDAAVGERAFDADAWSSPLMLVAVRRIQNSIQVTTMAARTSPALEELLGGLLRPPMVTTARAPPRGSARARPPRRPDPAEMAVIPGPREVGQHDADDEGRLDALAEPGERPAVKNPRSNDVRSCGGKRE